MNEREPIPTRRNEYSPAQRPRPDYVTNSEDPVVAERWEDGIREWGEAFAAFVTLGRPELHSHDVLAHFEKKYIVSRETTEEVIRDYLKLFGWTEALRRFRYDQSIAEDVLQWNNEAIVREMKVLCDLVESGGRIHVFAK